MALQSNSNELAFTSAAEDGGQLTLPPKSLAAGCHEPLLTSLRSLSGRVGIFGGTFDPVHVGHLSSAEFALRGAGLERVVFVPTARNQLKQNSPVAGNLARLEMLIQALSKEHNFYVSPVQLLGQTESFSVDLLRHISRESPQAELFLIVGSDCLETLGAWKEVHAMLKLAKLVIVERPGYPVAEGKRLEGFSDEENGAIFENVIRGLPDQVSSSQIRRELARGRETEGVLPDEVSALIKARGLYSPR